MKYSIADETLFKELINNIVEEDDLTARDTRQLKQAAVAATPENIFIWHLNEHTVFEEETDPAALRAGHRYRRVDFTPEGRLTDAQISAEETRLGIKLPEPWRNVYKFFNGGWNSDLYWGDRQQPKQADIFAAPSANEYLALQDVAPLKQFIAQDRPELDSEQIDERIIAIAYDASETILLDYRDSPPSVRKVYISEYDEDPLSSYEEEGYHWPNMSVFFRGLYIQDRII